MTPSPIVVTLHLTKVTKHTFRFDAPGDNPPVTAVYVQKAAFAEGKQPSSVKLTVEVTA